MDFDNDLTLGSHGPYQRFLSPNRGRSGSLPSEDFSGFLDCPMERRGDTPRKYRGRRHVGKDVRRSRYVNPDVIDRLDSAAWYQYHHEGPYDAVYPERNRDNSQSPIDAVRESNAEALKATPYHKILDSIERHRPLDGVAYYPPGHTDREGQTYDYEEGYNMMSDFGNFTRVPGFKFTDEDFRNDPFYNSPPKSFAPIRNVFRRRRREST